LRGRGEEKREIGIDREKQIRLDRNQERDKIREREMVTLASSRQL